MTRPVLPTGFVQKDSPDGWVCTPEFPFVLLQKFQKWGDTLLCGYAKEGDRLGNRDRGSG